MVGREQRGTREDNANCVQHKNLWKMRNWGCWERKWKKVEEMGGGVSAEAARESVGKVVRRGEGARLSEYAKSLLSRAEGQGEGEGAGSRTGGRAGGGLDGEQGPLSRGVVRHCPAGWPGYIREACDIAYLYIGIYHTAQVSGAVPPST